MAQRDQLKQMEAIQLTVSTTTNKVSYSGTGSRAVFAYTFKIFADGDLDVYIRDTNSTETLQTITTNYTVSGAGADAGGNVTFVTAPGSTDTVVIQRKLALTQGTDYVANDPFPAESHEDALDRLTFITQQIQEEVDRSIKASVTNTISSTEFAISATDRANKIFAFDASGDLAVTQEIGTFRATGQRAQATISVTWSKIPAPITSLLLMHLTPALVHSHLQATPTALSMT